MPLTLENAPPPTKMSRRERLKSFLKDWTPTITTWVQTIVLVGGGLFALFEYVDGQEKKVQRAMDYITKANSEPIISVRGRLVSGLPGIVNALKDLLVKEMSRDEMNVEYYDLVVRETMVSDAESKFSSDFYTMIAFLDEGALCVELELCPRNMLEKSNLWSFAHLFFRGYYPALCYMRKSLADPDLGRRVIDTYYPTSIDVCEAYERSLEAVQ